MKKLLVCSLFIIAFLQLIAQERQISFPHLSPTQTMDIRIGVLDIHLKYSRPSMRGRTIFGDLVPYNKIWRTGANKNTKIVFHDKVLVGDYELEGGTYTLFTKPNKDNWEIYFHTELDAYGVGPELDPKNIKAKITVPSLSMDKALETLSIDFNELSVSAAVLRIAWEKTSVAIPIKIPTDKILLERLTKERSVIADDYSMAAFILSEKQNNYSDALQAINRSIYLIENGKSFEEWLKNVDLKDRHLPNEYRLKSEILAKLGKKEQAIKCAELSLKIARLVKYDYYIEENLKNLEKWKQRE